MAATRIMPIHLNKGGTPAKALSDVIGYVGNPEKTDKGYLISSFHCSKETAAADFMLLRQSYLQRTGWTPKKGKEILAYHVRQSFSPGEITPREANRLGQEFARRFTKDKYAVIVCTHVDKAHIHNHIVWSSTKLDGTGKFQNFWNSEKAVQKLSDMICLENGYSVIGNPGKTGKTYDQWLSAEAKPSNRFRIRSIPS